MSKNTLNYIISDPIELNLSYIPFITEGGLYIPTIDHYSLGDELTIDLEIVNKNVNKNVVLKIEVKVIWITPQNALHHVLPGIGVQFLGSKAQSVRTIIEENLDKNIDIGGYTYGIMDERTIK